MNQISKRVKELSLIATLLLTLAVPSVSARADDGYGGEVQDNGWSCFAISGVIKGIFDDSQSLRACDPNASPTNCPTNVGGSVMTIDDLKYRARDVSAWILTQCMDVPRSLKSVKAILDRQPVNDTGLIDAFNGLRIEVKKALARMESGQSDGAPSPGAGSAPGGSSSGGSNDQAYNGGSAGPIDQAAFTFTPNVGGAGSGGGGSGGDTTIRLYEDSDGRVSVGVSVHAE